LSFVTPQPEQLDRDAFAELMERADEGPVVMLNLLAFVPEGGAERYGEYGAAVMPLLEKAGASVVFQAPGSSPLIGQEGWDLVLLVEYPTRGTFLEMIGSPEYAAIAHLRTEALSRSELHPLVP
jgi:uncharacterized protein (DUF1330 family)